MDVKCLIIEDEIPAQKLLEKYISDYPSLKLIGICKNAIEAMDLLRKATPDLIFLDINMPKLNGIDFLKNLKNPPLVIITSAYREYALESFDLDVVDYLKKPFPFERFFKAVNKAIEKLHPLDNQQFIVNEEKRLQLEGAFIFVKEDKITYKVCLNEILYIESVGDYIKIFTDKKVYLTYQSLKKLESLLPSNIFPRVHKSFIVSIAKINTLEGNFIKINNIEIPIGQTYRKNFSDLINALSIS